MHYMAITTFVISILLAGASANPDRKRSEREHAIEMYKRQSYYWSASQPGGNGGWPDFTHSMIIPSMSAYYPGSAYPSMSASYAPGSAYVSSSAYVYPSAAPSYSQNWYSGASTSDSAASTQFGQPRPTGGSSPSAPAGQVSDNAGSSLSIGSRAFFALGALTGIAAFML